MDSRFYNEDIKIHRVKGVPMNTTYIIFAILLAGTGIITPFINHWFTSLLLFLFAGIFLILGTRKPKTKRGEKDVAPDATAKKSKQLDAAYTIPEEKLTKTSSRLPAVMPGEAIGIEKHYEYKLWNTGVLEILCYCGTQTVVSIPDTLAGHPVVWLGEWAFHKTPALREVIIPDGVSAIGFHTFDSCENLELVRIPDSVESMWASAFRGCPKVTLMANPGSYAERFCMENGIAFRTSK